METCNVRFAIGVWYYMSGPAFVVLLFALSHKNSSTAMNEGIGSHMLLVAVIDDCRYIMLRQEALSLGVSLRIFLFISFIIRLDLHRGWLGFDESSS